MRGMFSLIARMKEIGNSPNAAMLRRRNASESRTHIMETSPDNKSINEWLRRGMGDQIEWGDPLNHAEPLFLENEWPRDDGNLMIGDLGCILVFIDGDGGIHAGESCY